MISFRAAPLFLLLSCLVGVASASRVGIPDFTSTSPQPNTSFLAKTLPASLAEPLGSQSDVQIVERSELERILRERGVQLSGGWSDIPDSLRPLLPADALVLGQYGGGMDSLTLQVRIVEIGTGIVRGSFSRHGPLQEILAGMPTLAAQIAQSLRGDTSGKLTLSTTPSGATVELDGRLLGRTPLVDQRIAPGRHELSITLAGHETWKDSIVVEPNGTPGLKIALEVAHDRSGFWFGGGGYMQALTRDASDPVGPQFGGYFTMVMRGAKWGLEASYLAPTTHTYLVKYTVPMGERDVERDIETDLARLLVLRDVVQKDRWSVHLGAGIGLVHSVATPGYLDSPNSRKETKHLGGDFVAGFRFELAPWFEILGEGHAFGTPDQITVTDVKSRDLFESVYEQRMYAIQLWNAQIAARVRL